MENETLISALVLGFLMIAAPALSLDILVPGMAVSRWTTRATIRSAKQKVPPSALEPRKLKNLRKVTDDKGGNLVTGVGRGMQSQGAHPRVIVSHSGLVLRLVLPVPASITAHYGEGSDARTCVVLLGAWMKSFATTEVTDFGSCGCPRPRYIAGWSPLWGEGTAAGRRR